MGRGPGQGRGDGRRVGGALLIALLAGCALFRPLYSPFGKVVYQPGLREATVEESRVIDRVNALLEDEEFEAAEKAIDEALDGGHDHPQLFMLKGRLLAERNELEDSLPWFERAVGAAPGWVEPRIYLANIYLDLNRPAAAESVCEDLDRLFPEHPAGPYGQGICRWRRELTDEARAFFDEALQRDPDYAYALKARAAVAALDGDPSLQERLLHRYIAQVADDAEAWATLGALAQDKGLLNDAVRYYKRSWEVFPDGRVAARLADLAREQRDPAAERYWRARASANP